MKDNNIKALIIIGFLLCIVFMASWFFTHLSLKYAWFAVALIVIIAVSFLGSFRYLLYLVVLMIPFKFYISYTIYLETSVLAIYIIAFLLFLRAVIDKDSLKGFFKNPYSKYIKWIVLIYLVSTINTVLYQPQVNLAMGVLTSAFVSILNLFAALFVFYFVVRMVSNQKILRNVLIIMTLTPAIHIFLSYMQIFKPFSITLPTFLWVSMPSGVDASGTWFTLGGRIGDTELFAEYLLLIFFFQLCTLQVTRNRGIKLVVWIVAILGIIFGLLTSARSFVIVFVIGIVMLFLLQRQSLTKVKTMLLICSALIVSIFPVRYIEKKIPGVSYSFKRFEVMVSLWHKGYPLERVIDRGFSWANTTQEVVKHPIIGHGPVFSWYIGKFHTDPHSLYLDILYKFGIIGLIIYMAFFLKILWDVWFLRKRVRENSIFYAMLTYEGIIIILFLIDEIKIGYTRFASTQNIVWLIFGVIVATMNIIKRETVNSQEILK